MKVLLHVCCAGCSCYPVRQLRQLKMEVVGFWYNPNIHPFSEYQRRMMAMGYFAQRENLPMVWRDEYDVSEWFTRINPEGKLENWEKTKRCRKCYALRLEKAVEEAKSMRYDYFSTTLLYSKFQDHGVLKEICQRLEKEMDMKFYYFDFREGWKEGLNIARNMGLYRQHYCGCIFSEQERYLGEERK